jgi:hypothetical protein
MNPFLIEHYAKFKDELDGYTYIHNDNINLVKPGGLIKFINLNGELKGGGIVLNVYNKDKLTKMTFYMKIPGKTYNLSYSRNYIFFTTSAKSKMRKILTNILKSPSL